jgi:hypothetical protein
VASTEEVQNYLQLFLSIAAVIGMAYGGFRYFNSYIDKRSKENVKDALGELEKEHSEIKHEISLLKVAMEYIEKFFIDPLKLKGNKDE